MEAATATDVCDGLFKNITVHGNATIITQTGPKLVYSLQQRKALELMECFISFPSQLANEKVQLKSKKVQLRSWHGTNRFR